jgi:phosphoribosylaminoimidazole carboxylase PurE protein
MSKSLVGIVMGSDSDLAVMEETAKVLEKFGIEYEMTVSSAHRSPQRASRYAKEAGKRGLRVLIAGAGGAAHLAGVLASFTLLPVIAVPLSSPLKGLDSFYSTLQMPSGVPVATMGVGKSGAKNAAILAAQILALKYPKIKEKLRRHKANLAREVQKKARNLKWKSRKG